MNWSDERYVRVYTRDTTSWVRLGWEAQALFLLLLRKVDRAGVLELGQDGEEGLADLLRMPPEVVKNGLDRLLRDGCITRDHGSALVVRNFIEAQETRQTDRQRQHESRARRRAIGRHSLDTGHTPSHAVTAGHDASPDVTPGHTVSGEPRHVGEIIQHASHAVTNGHSVPCRAVPSVPSGSGEEIFTNEPDAGKGPAATGWSPPAREPPAPPGMPEYAPLPDEPPPGVARDHHRREPPRQQERTGFAIPGSTPGLPSICSRCKRPASLLVWQGRERLCDACRLPPAAARAAPEELRAWASALKSPRKPEGEP